MSEPSLDIRFTRTGGRQAPIDRTFRGVRLDPDEVTTWLGTEPPHIPHSRNTARDVAAYRLEFRRGAERRVVQFTQDALDARMEPLVSRLVRSSEGR